MADKIPRLNALLENYPDPTEVPRDLLYRELGWDDLIDNKDYENTCAIRVSLCLVRCGMTLPAISRGSLKVKKDPFKGQWLEVSRRRLAEYLARKDVWGEPIKESTRSKMVRHIGTGGGVISFGPWPGYAGGHIDVISGRKLDMPRPGGPMSAILQNAIVKMGLDVAVQCQSDCYWEASELWYWRAP